MTCMKGLFSLIECRKTGETFDEYLTVLKELRKTCEICDCMDDSLLKDQLINGIVHSNLQEKLLQKRGSSLGKCTDACHTAESAAKQVKEMLHSEMNHVGLGLHPRSCKPQPGARPTHSGPRIQPTGENNTSGQNGQGNTQCRFCGRYHVSQPGVCPALRCKCNVWKAGTFCCKVSNA